MITNTQDQILTNVAEGLLRVILDSLLSLIKEQADKWNLPVAKTEISKFVDPEQGTEKVIITQWVETDAQTALAYWDCLGEAVKEATEALSSELADFILEHISIEVRWLQETEQ